jgi:hypothetical protein
MQTFADNAPRLHAAGWAVLAARGKSPVIKYFNKMKFRPGAKTVTDWAQEKPDADIVIVPGLCCTGQGRKGIIAVDPDNETAIGQAIEFFGDTPGKHRTRRGRHHLYDGDGIDLGKVTGLREIGFEIDIKHGKNGSGILAAPPSRHEKDPSFRYAYEDCDETVVRHLPPFPVAKLKALLEKHAPKASAVVAEIRRDHSRKQSINDYLIPHVFRVASEEELLDIARTWNASLKEQGYEPLPDHVLVRRARVVWQQRDRFVPMIGQGGVARMTRNEMDALLALNPKTAGDALLLLSRLKIEHSARCARGEAFALDVNAMTRGNFIAGWTRERYQNAKDLLLEAKLLKYLSKFRMTRNGRDAARYTF